jgi:diguanylate cyclase (GGDEF)-like protein
MASDQKKILREIDEHEIAVRREFLGFSNQDAAGLDLVSVVVGEDLQEIVDTLFDHIMAFDEINYVISEPGSRERLTGLLKRYLLNLGRFADQPAYSADRQRIGLTHRRKGIAAKWFLGAYAKLNEIIVMRVARRYADRPEDLAAAVIALNRILSYDMLLAAEAYQSGAAQPTGKLSAQLTQARGTIAKLARVDEATGVSSAAHLMECLEMERVRTRRYGHPFTVAAVSVDYFEEIVNEYGQKFGNLVLREVAGLIRETVRPSDQVGRIDEGIFVVGLVECTGERACDVAERLRMKVSITPIQLDGISASTTVSIGVSCWHEALDDLEALLVAAGTAMARAQKNGGNRVAVDRTIVLTGIETSSDGIIEPDDDDEPLPFVSGG